MNPFLCGRLIYGSMTNFPKQEVRPFVLPSFIIFAMEKAEVGQRQWLFLPFENPKRYWEVSQKEKERKKSFKSKKRKGKKPAGLRGQRPVAPRSSEDPCSCTVIVPQEGDNEAT